MEETRGLGVNYVLDFSGKGLSLKTKQFIINCMGLNSVWVVHTPEFQLDPPQSKLLYYKNSSVCFSNYECYGEMGLKMG
jgi:hypothetical protein